METSRTRITLFLHRCLLEQSPSSAPQYTVQLLVSILCIKYKKLGTCLEMRTEETNECDPGLEMRTAETNKCDPGLEMRTAETNKCDPSHEIRAAEIKECDPGLEMRTEETEECDLGF
jgi:hypothetical protein